MTRSLAYIIMCFMWIATFRPAVCQSKTHGTVNVLLANKNGLVLVTDSRLSNEMQRPMGVGRKLYVLDDHTVVSIADFYSDTGPTIGSSASALTNVPGILRALIEMHNGDAKNKANQPIHLTFDDLINLYTFCLTALANLDSAEDPIRKPSGAQLTLAGYEGDKIRVMQVKLEPDWNLNAWRYIQRERQDRFVKDVLLTRFAGITNVIDAILATPTDKSVTTDPILSYFTSEIARNNGRDLTLEDMRQAAVQLKERTSRRYPNIVGGKTQFVTMGNGHILTKELLSAEPDTENLGVIKSLQVTGIGIVGSSVSSTNIFGAPAQHDLLSYIFVSMGFTKLHERLDGKAYIRSNFENCILEYEGKGPVLFDSHNVVNNTTLEVSNNVRDKDEFLVEIHKNFPSLKVIRVADF